MPQPTANEVHVDALLTNISVAYIQSRTSYVAGQVFPVVPVDKKSDKFFKYDKNDWLRDEAAKRAPSTESAGSGYGLSTDDYNAEVYAFHKDLDDQTLANADAPLNLDREATEFVAQRMLMRRERQWATDFFKTGVWGTDNTSATDWDDYANSDPLLDIETGKAAILGVTGLEANTLVLSYNTFRALKNHPDLVDRIKYTSSQNITVDLLARMFEIDRVLVLRAVYAANEEGETASYKFVDGTDTSTNAGHALLCHVATSPGLLTPSAGYTFAWRGVSDGMGETIGTSRIPVPLTRSERIESQMAWDNKVVAADLGYFFSGIV